MTIQETHNGENFREKGKKHSICFSGGRQEGAIHHGVGIRINNEFRSYIQYVEPINARILIMTLRGTVPIYIFSIYAPTAEADSETKDNFHELLRTHIKNKKRKTGMVIIGADTNAKRIAPGNQDEEVIGPYIFGHGEEISEGAGVEQSRCL